MGVINIKGKMKTFCMQALLIKTELQKYIQKE